MTFVMVSELEGRIQKLLRCVTYQHSFAPKIHLYFGTASNFSILGTVQGHLPEVTDWVMN